MVAKAIDAAHRAKIHEALTENIDTMRALRKDNPEMKVPFVFAGYVFDATQQELWLSKAATETFGRPKKTPGGPAVCSLMVQEQSIRMAGATEELTWATRRLCPPCIVQAPGFVLDVGFGIRDS